MNKSSIVPTGYLRREAAARYLNVSLRTLGELQRRRVIPFAKIGTRVCLFRITDLDKAIAKLTVQAVGE